MDMAIKVDMANCLPPIYSTHIHQPGTTHIHQPGTENFPAAQSVQVSAPDWYFPAPHSEQEKAPTAEIQPASQAAHSVEPADQRQNLVSSFVLMWRQQTGKIVMTILLKSNLRVYLQRRKEHNWCRCLPQSGPVWYFPRTIYKTRTRT